MNPSTELVMCSWDTNLFFFFFQGELLLLDHLKLVTEVEFGSLLLQFGEFVLVFGNLLESWLDTDLVFCVW